MTNNEKEIRELRAEVENIKHVLFDLLEELKKAEIPYRKEYISSSK